MSDTTINTTGEEDENFVPADKIESNVRDKILHTLSIFPRLSHSMLQVGIGTSLSPYIWRPILGRLKEEGKVIERTVHARTPSGRDMHYDVLMLPRYVDTPFHPDFGESVSSLPKL